MTAPLDISPAEDASALAAEYVLGVLALPDRLAVEVRAKTDAAFAALISGWETHFEALNDQYVSVPAPDMLPQIEARLFGRASNAKGSAAKARNWWGFLAGAGVAAALVVAVVLVVPTGTAPGPVLTASLSADAQALAFAASYQDGALTLNRVSGAPAEAGRDYELWLIVGDAAPVSLGLIKDAQTTRTLDALAPGAVLAVSLEPTGGSTTGAPSGPVLVTGEITLS